MDSNSVVTIIVGVGQWEEYTKPLIDSIRRHEPSADIIVCDNGVKIPSVVKLNTDVEFVTTELVCYASAINMSVLTYIDFDWFVIMNNDVRCDNKYLEYVQTLYPKAIFGNKVHPRYHKKFISPTAFVDGWIYAVPRQAINDVGMWDSKFKIAGFEDADYCIRAHEAGYSIRKSNLPFTHLEEHVRTTFDNYKKHRLDNIEYLIKKHSLRRR